LREKKNEFGGKFVIIVINKEGNKVGEKNRIKNPRKSVKMKLFKG
jgi:hypothetical protein